MGRYTLPGRIKASFLSSEPADPLAPTAGELSAGVDLVGSGQGEALAELDGWVVSPSSIPTPDYTSHLVGNVPGDQTFGDSRMAFYMDDTVQTIYSALSSGTSGFVAIMRDGDSSGDECELFPVTVQSRVRRPARDQAHIFDVNFAIGVPYDGTIA